MSDPDAPINRLPIRVRGYAARTRAAPAEKTGPIFLPDIGPSDWVLVFDCETRTTPDQNLTFGAYQLRYRGRLVDAGLFYDPEVVVGSDLSILHKARADALRIRPEEPFRLRRRESFVRYVLFRAHDLGATIVGLNLPFDLSRLAIKPAASARRSMKGGFTFQIHPWEGERHVRVKHINSRMALIDLTEGAGRSRRDSLVVHNIKPARRSGYFVDVRTLAGALLGGSFSLEKLGSLLGIKHPKLATPSLGLPLDLDQVRYGMGDVQATWECFDALAKRYAALGLSSTPLHRIFSEAGLGKAYLREMGIQPWTRVQREFPAHLIGKLMSSYYGGRAEVRIRRVETEVLYCDFLSMYPTVCTLLQLWPFVISKGVELSDATAWTRDFLERVSAEDLRDPKLWPDLNVLVQVAPEDDVFPIRARYGADAGVRGASSTIGVNRLTSAEPLWFTLADCIAAKLLGSGKAPKALEATRFQPREAQDALKPVNVAGNPDYSVDPRSEDFYKRVVELRRAVKREASASKGERATALKADQNALKLLANSTSYGIFIEIKVQDVDKAERLVVHSTSDEPYEVMSDKVEDPGRYFHPLLGVMIPGAARLMLALAEHNATSAGLGWVFCDTDSLAIARPAGMSREAFRKAAFSVCDWFKPLNPYEEPGGAERPSILQMEDANFAVGRAGDNDALEPLYAFAISAKRYALYNHSDGGDFELRKASAHGLGQLVPPYPDPERADTIDRLGVEQWQEDLWRRIVTAARSGTVERVRHDNPRLSTPAAIRFAATTPVTLKWFKSYNALPVRSEQYADQVKPFNFLLTYQPKSQLRRMAETEGDAPQRQKRSSAMPASAFHKDPSIGADEAFDRNTGEAIAKVELQSVAQSLRGFHRHEERKFLRGELGDIGTTRRRHVLAIAVECIGKETEGYGEAESDDEDPFSYPLADTARHRLAAIIDVASVRHGQRECCKAAKITDRTLRDAAKGSPKTKDADLLRLAEVADLLDQTERIGDAEKEELVEFVRERRKSMKLVDFAREVGEDPGNVSRVLSGKRPPYPRFLRAVQRLRAELSN